MAENSAIQWTHHTFNPWRGCTKVHAGCTHCYAESNYSVKMHGVKWGPNGTRVRLSDAGWKEPLKKWNRAAEKAGERHRVFCASLADVFEEWDGPILDHKGDRLCFYEPKQGWLSQPAYVEEPPAGARFATMDDMRRDLFRLIQFTPWLDWLLLTKRPENIKRFWHHPNADIASDPQFRHNVWLGTSVSDQATANEWIPRLLECRDLAPVLFVSAEPLLGPVDLDGVWPGGLPCPGAGPYVPGIDWLIVGGESGPKARRCEVAWVRKIVSQCRDAGVPCFTKQLGAFIVDRNDAGFDGPDECNAWPEPLDVEDHINGFREEYQGADCRVVLRDKKGGDWSEWPVDLRVREFPRVHAGAPSGGGLTVGEIPHKGE
jgi:protein gp37